MTEEQIQKNKEEFIALCREHIQRDGLEDLLAYLEKTDFYTAPSSTAFHLNEDGGLCRHSINVFQTARTLLEQYVAPAKAEGRLNSDKEISLESVAVCTLFHDLCKVNLYKKVDKFKKDENGRWVTYPGYEVEDKFPFGHGEKSCFAIMHYMKMLPDEMLAVRWHMGMFDLAPQGCAQSYAFKAALEKSPLVALVHSADFLSSNLLEKTKKYK
ncbi:MAG: hypothetical protein J6N92_00205 [Alloprevotella sp.]|nr:hypothetical protein [Alloprevotella sp.]